MNKSELIRSVANNTNRNQREMVNPRTREKVITRERRTFKFVVSKTLNDKL